MAEDLAAMGAPPEIIEQFMQEDVKAAVFEVLPENWQALNLFLSLDTQWNRSLMPLGEGFASRPVGINYTALESLMRMQGVEDTADAFYRIRIMELAALEAMNEQ